MSVRKFAVIGGILCLLFIAQADAGRRGGPPKDRPKNVIVLIADGMGPEYEEAAKIMDPYGGGALDRLDPNPAEVDTHSLRIVRDSEGNEFEEERVTDSAASATAIATGFKTRNGAVSVDLQCATNQRDLGIKCCDETTLTCEGELRTALEAAEAMGKATGIVSNTYVQDATPGVWAAHWYRREGNPIAAQQVDAGLEVLLGSGSYYMLSEPPGSRDDGRNLIQEMIDSGYLFVDTRDELNALEGLGKKYAGLLGIFGSIWTTEYVLDREFEGDPLHSPSVVEMVDAALKVLDGRSKEGFFLVIEGAYTDWLGHNRDLPGMIQEQLEFNDAVQLVHDRFGPGGETLIVATADHETGGLDLIDGTYDVDFVESVKCTTDYMWGHYTKMGWTSEMIAERCLGDVELAGKVEDALDPEFGGCDNSEIGLSRLLSEKAGVKWLQNPLEDPTTEWDPCDEGSHTRIEVSVYAAGPGAEAFDGISDNTEIGQALHRAVCGKWPCP